MTERRLVGFEHAIVASVNVRHFMCVWNWMLIDVTLFVVVVVVTSAAASHSASNVLLVPLHCEKVSFQSRSEAVRT